MRLGSILVGIFLFLSSIAFARPITFVGGDYYLYQIVRTNGQSDYFYRNPSFATPVYDDYDFYYSIGIGGCTRSWTRGSIDVHKGVASLESYGYHCGGSSNQISMWRILSEEIPGGETVDFSYRVSYTLEGRSGHFAQVDVKLFDVTDWVYKGFYASHYYTRPTSEEYEFHKTLPNTDHTYRIALFVTMKLESQVGFNSDARSSITLDFSDQDHQPVATPEPASILLSCLGLSGVLFLRRK